MAKSLRIMAVLILTFSLLVLNVPVLADDSGHTITLTINWVADNPQDRPQSITVGLYRNVDGEEVAIDQKTVTAADKVSNNTWQLEFTYNYGLVWEYSFKILKTEPFDGLYDYNLVESGNGTNHYTFDYVYASGQTQMNISAVWEGDDAKNRPESLQVDLVALDSDGQPERTILLTEKDGAWNATVSGLNEDPASYYLIVHGADEAYESVITRGDSPNTYVITNTPATATKNVQSGMTDRMVQAIDGVAGSVDVQQAEKIEKLWLNAFFYPVILAALIVVSILAVKKHRKMVRKRRRRN